MTPPLAILALYHPDSKPGRDLALVLYRRFTALGGGPGLRIPVSFCPVREDRSPPEHLELDGVEHTLVVPLVDGRMARRARAEDRTVADRWAARVTGLVEKLAGRAGAHGVLPVAVDAGAFGLDARLEQRSFVRLDVLDEAAKPDHLAFQVAIAALELLRSSADLVRPTAKAPITLFVSHAKIDLPKPADAGADDPVGELLLHLARGPVDGWYDAKKIPSGLRFDQAIEQGVIHCDVVVCVVTDHWSEREWCRREALFAKRSARPLLIVDALSSGVERLFPYLGNARAIRWQPRKPETVVLAALLEALRHRHAIAVLERSKRAGDCVFGVQPEALTLRRVPPGVHRVVYPDPPLPLEELEQLAPVLAFDDGVRTIELTTPLTDLARWDRPPELDLVGLSLSTASDLEAWGAGPEHLATLADDLATMLLIAGLRLAYGGVLDHGGAKDDTFGCNVLRECRSVPSMGDVNVDSLRKLCGLDNSP